jgi:hypothetical protein
VPFWELLADVYQGRSAWIDYRPDGSLHPTRKSRRYLPQLPGETSEEYRDRLLTSHFADRFSRTVRDFVGLVFKNGVNLTGVPDAILEHWDNLGGPGLGGDRLCGLLGLHALQYGHGFALVDFPEHDPSIESHADALARGRSPYWRRIDPRDIISWRYSTRSGVQRLEQVVIRQSEIAPAGEYGEASQTTYLRLRPGTFDTFALVKERGQKPRAVRIPDRCGRMGHRRRGMFYPLPEVPLVCLYGGDRTGYFESNPTLLSLAELSLVHYQVSSDHRQKMHYCCFPTPVRVGGQGEDITLGPRRLMDVPLGGSFGWSEPNSQSLAMSRIELADISRQLDFLGLEYLAKPSDRQAAMTSVIAAQKIESSLYLFAADFAAGLTDCLRFHARWLGLDDGGRAELDTKFFENVAIDPQMLLAYLRMRELGDLTSPELRKLASAGRYIPDTVTLEDDNGSE